MDAPVPGLEHSFPFDPTHGFSRATLLEVQPPDEPGDFVAFWRATWAEAMAAPLDLVTREIASPHADFRVWEATFASLGGVRVGAWVTAPRSGPTEGGAVVYHGYGGRSGPEFGLPGPEGPVIFPCARGFNLSAHPGIPGEAMAHVVHGLAERETYVHRGCAADVWRAASALLEMFPSVAGDLRYQGASFGGGIGALAVPWDDRFRTAFLDMPSFGHYPLRVTLPCVGSGQAIRRRWKKHPAVLEVLAYYDAAVAARHLALPVFVAAALFDPSVPPPGQFAVFNAAPEPKELFIRTAAHFSSPYEISENRRLHQRLDGWFRRPLAR
jgi:cephalosporin-C deacetylase